MTKKVKKADAESAENESIQLLHDHIRLQFVANADVIASHEKPERLLRMIQICPELKPVNRANKELWKIVEKVRHDVLGGKTRPAKKKVSKTCSEKRK